MKILTLMKKNPSLPPSALPPFVPLGLNSCILIYGYSLEENIEITVYFISSFAVVCILFFINFKSLFIGFS